MNVPRLAFLLLPLTSPLWAACPGTARLEEALILVSQTNPVLLAERATLAEQGRQKPWDASLTVGYSVTDTLELGDAGPNAALRVKIPLWDRSSQLQAAKDHAAAVAKEDGARAALLADVQSLCEQAHQVRALEAAHQFTRDRLTYRQERVNQGIDPGDALWGDASAFQVAKHQAEQETAKLDTRRLTLARHYGGAEWERLRALLEAMTQ